jgi:hypothetical protein
MKPNLREVLDWAKTKIASGQEPPWAWFQYMKLIETLEAILAGAQATGPTGNSLQSAVHPATHLRLVGSTDPQGTSQHHPDTVRVQLPT